MQDIQLNQGPTKTILTFQANRLDFFYETSNQIGYSFHVGHIKSIGIITDKKGKHKLVVKTGFMTNEDEVSEEALARVNQLVAAVQEAMKTVKL